MPDLDAADARLPTFYVIGAAKSGTTSLIDLLRPHPQVFVPLVKEPMFFSHDENWERGVGWYLATHFAGADGRHARGEGTPHYLVHGEKVAARMAEVHRDRPPRLVVIFRDPVARAYSWYWNMVMEGLEPLSFEEALEAEPQRLREHAAHLERTGEMTYGYLAGSRYATLLAPFLARFEREQFLFLLQGDLRDDPAGTLGRLQRFLGLDELAPQEALASNPAAMPRSRRVHRLVRERAWFQDAAAAAGATCAAPAAQGAPAADEPQADALPAALDRAARPARGAAGRRGARAGRADRPRSERVVEHRGIRLESLEAR